MVMTKAKACRPFRGLLFAVMGCLASLAGCVNPVHHSAALQARILAPPAGVEQLFRPLTSPAVAGTTAAEAVATAISGYREQVVNADLRLATGVLNHTRGSAIHVLSFNAGADSGVELLPIERSTGQFSMETTSASANRLIEQGVNIVAAVNADPFNIFNGWNVGIVKIDGTNYSGWSPDSESAVVVRFDGSIDIVEKVPVFQLRWRRSGHGGLGGLDGAESGLVKEVSYFDRESGRNKAFRQVGGSVSIYPGGNYRGGLDLRGKAAYLVAPEVNGVSVVLDREQRPVVQFAPFKGKVVGTPDAATRAAFLIPAGLALVVVDSPAGQAPSTSSTSIWSVGDVIQIDCETDDPAWSGVRHALGAGFTTAMLVKDGKLGDGAADDRLVSSRTVFGIRADGSGFFAVIDKPVGSPSDGISLRKLGQLALAYGAVKAVNLDGGGSSTLAMRRPEERHIHPVNVPSDGTERPVANKWGLAIKPATVKYGDGVDVAPREVTLLAGSEFRFKALGWRGDRFSPLGSALSFGMSDAALGLISPATGQFLAAMADVQGYVVAETGGMKGAAKLTITRSPDSLSFERPVIVLNACQALAVLPTMLKDGVPVRYSPSALTYTLSTDTLGRIDTATGIFTAAQVQGKQLTLTVSYGPLSARTQLSIGALPVVVENFEAGLGAYTAGGTRLKSAAVSLVHADAFAGRHSLRLAWQADPSQPGTLGAYLVDRAMATALAGYPRALGVHVFIPEALAGTTVWVRGQLRDADNKVVTINYNAEGEPLSACGWTFMTAAIPEGYRAPFRFDQPLRLLLLKTHQRIDSFVDLADFTALYSDDTDLPGRPVTSLPVDRLADPMANNVAVTPCATPRSLKTRDESPH